MKSDPVYIGVEAEATGDDVLSEDSMGDPFSPVSLEVQT
jgi:hypothetical protein